MTQPRTLGKLPSVLGWLPIPFYGVAVGETPPGVPVAAPVGVPAALGVRVAVAVTVGEVPRVPVTAAVGVVAEVGEAPVLAAGVADAMADAVLMALLAGVDAVMVETEGAAEPDPHAVTTTVRPSEPASTKRRNEDRR